MDKKKKKTKPHILWFVLRWGVVAIYVALGRTHPNTGN